MEKIEYGWKCPSCGAIMAPWQPSCTNCTGKNQKPIEYHTAGPNITIRSDETPNTITWTSPLGNRITATAQDKLCTTLKSIGIDI